MRHIFSSAVAFACVFAGAMLGVLLRAALPSNHVSPESKESIKLAIGLVSTMAAMVLGLLVASSKAAYDTNNADLTQMSSQIILLDRLLANYGPDAQQARDLLRNSLIRQINLLWPNEQGLPPAGPIPRVGEDTYFQVQELSPKDERQQLLRGEALTTAFTIGKTRWLFYMRSTNSIPVGLVVMMISWLTVVFISFGVFAPRNWTVTGSLLIAAASVSGAIFLILEMYSSFGGLIHIPSTSLRYALTQLGK